MFQQGYGGNLVPLTPASGPGGTQTTLITFLSAAASNRVNPGANANVRISVTTQVLWIKLGDSSVTATAGSANEILCPIGHTDINMGPNTHLAFIEDASPSRGSIFKF